MKGSPQAAPGGNVKPFAQPPHTTLTLSAQFFFKPKIAQKVIKFIKEDINTYPEEVCQGLLALAINTRTLGLLGLASTKWLTGLDSLNPRGF